MTVTNHVQSVFLTFVALRFAVLQASPLQSAGTECSTDTLHRNLAVAEDFLEDPSVLLQSKVTPAIETLANEFSAKDQGKAQAEKEDASVARGLNPLWNATKRVMLWSTLRSGSSAFVRSFMERSDTKVFFEWLHDVYYYGPDKRSTNYQDHKFQHFTYDVAFSEFLAKPPRGKSLVLVKDQAFYIVPNGTDASSFVWPKVLDNFQHTFLVRSPQIQVPSLVKVMRQEQKSWSVADGAPASFDPAEVGVQQLHTLFYAVQRHTNTTPVLVDVNDVFRDPAATLSAYCDRIGVKFEDGMLEWEAGWRKEFGYDDEDDPWVKDMMTSTGFHKCGSTETCRNKSHERDSEPLPPSMKKAMDEAMEFYFDLLSHKMVVPDIVRP